MMATQKVRWGRRKAALYVSDGRRPAISSRFWKAKTAGEESKKTKVKSSSRVSHASGNGPERGLVEPRGTGSGDCECRLQTADCSLSMTGLRSRLQL